MKEGYWSKRVDVQRAHVQSTELNINLVSQDYGINILQIIRVSIIEWGCKCVHVCLAVHLCKPAAGVIRKNVLATFLPLK